MAGRFVRSSKYRKYPRSLSAASGLVAPHTLEIQIELNLTSHVSQDMSLAAPQERSVCYGDSVV